MIQLYRLLANTNCGKYLFLALVIGLVPTLLPGANVRSRPTAYYPFDGDAQDMSGFSRHGLPRGAPAFAAGYRGQALSLDGVNDLVELPAELMRDDFTVAFWIMTTLEAPRGDLWFEGISLVDGEVCGSPEGGDTGIALIDEGEVIYGSLESQVDVNDGQWHAIAVTRNQELGRGEVYIDGILVGARSGDDDGPIEGMPWIGVGQNPCRANEDFGWFEGLIDELHFYDRALSAAAIKQLADKNQVYFPHVFNVGGGNDTLLSISNNLPTATEVSIVCHNQEGVESTLLSEAPLASNAQMAFRIPSDFVVGSCQVWGGVTVSGTWNFNVNSNVFNVGISGLSSDQMATTWNFPVGFAANNSSLGAAVYNPRDDESTLCSVRVYQNQEPTDFDPSQTSQFDEISFQEFSFEVPAQGQRAQFFGDPFQASSGMLSFVKADLDCTDPVLTVLLTQDAANGFPTPVEGNPVP